MCCTTSALSTKCLAQLFKDAVLITTAGTGLYGLDVAGGYIAGYDIAIFGPGPVGLMTVQACKQLRAARVILVGTRPRPALKWDTVSARTILLMPASRTRSRLFRN